jgi:hypothetical protein
VAKSRAKPVPPGGEDHPSRRRKIPPSKEVQQQSEKNYDPKTGKRKGALNQPVPGRPLIPMPTPPLGGFRDPDRTPWNQPGRGGVQWQSTRNKNLWGFLK